MNRQWRSSSAIQTQKPRLGIVVPKDIVQGQTTHLERALEGAISIHLLDLAAVHLAPSGGTRSLLPRFGSGFLMWSWEINLANVQK